MHPVMFDRLIKLMLTALFTFLVCYALVGCAPALRTTHAEDAAALHPSASRLGATQVWVKDFDDCQVVKRDGQQVIYHCNTHDGRGDYTTMSTACEQVRPWAWKCPAGTP